ncbi:hypothetical protein Vretimale_4578 [Volvox reticuliferus]|uniref:Uncharacterized protein n=1 Tax=Volvox reticuliferus TaxID=1737510 RepID=A0A8J4DHC2_9CHLO|nr:hypothetical protein Vretimale_4578 [Volvox reticuliferus]
MSPWPDAAHQDVYCCHDAGPIALKAHRNRLLDSCHSAQRAAPPASVRRCFWCIFTTPSLMVLLSSSPSPTSWPACKSHGPGAPPNHSTTTQPLPQPTDLAALLGALPALTELHLTRACNLLPDPAILLHIPTSASSDIAASHSPGPQAQPPAGHGAAAPLQFPAAAAAAAVAEAAGGGGAFPVVAMAGAGLAETAGGHPTLLALPLPTSSGATPPLAERLRLLSLCHAGYDFSTDEGAMQAAALGGLRGLQELTITLEPVAEEGLNRLPESWSLLTGLTALRLGGHQRLRRLPSWLSGSLRRLRELTLTSCGFYRVPAAALAGLAQLRLLSLDSCPLGRGSAAVSLDAWWPPEEGPEGEAQDKGEEAGGSGGEVGRGGESGMARLEVLQLRDCDILALPYTVTRLTNIRRLELGGNPLGELALPVSSGRNSSQMRDVVLRYLKESGDRGFSQLAANTRLKHLGLERCGLKSVPLGVPELTQLASLDLRSLMGVGRGEREGR